MNTDSKDYPLLQSIEAMVSTISARGEILACNGIRVKKTCFSIAEIANRKLANAIA